jgi:hypothetical protein
MRSAGNEAERDMTTTALPQKPSRKARLPADRTHSEDGVDLTLIRWMLSLTPAARLKVLQQNVRSILRLRGENTDS